MLLYWFLLPLAWLAFHLIWRFEVVGRENLEAVRDGRAFVVASNHIANLDPVFILLVIFDWSRMIVLAKEELFRNPLAGWFLHCMGAVSIDRGKGDTATLEQVTAACRKGKGLLIFPEGTRTKTGGLGKLKSGAFVVAAAAGADMVPCRIIYHTKDGKMHPFCRIRICFGPAIPADELQVKDETRKVAEFRRMKQRLTNALEDLLKEHHFEDLPMPPLAPPPRAKSAPRPRPKTGTAGSETQEAATPQAGPSAPEQAEKPEPSAPDELPATELPTLTLDDSAVRLTPEAAPEDAGEKPDQTGE